MLFLKELFKCFYNYFGTLSLVSAGLLCLFLFLLYFFYARICLFVLYFMFFLFIVVFVHNLTGFFVLFFGLY